MPDLGEHAGAVLAAYGVTILLLVLLLALSALRGSQVRRALARFERETRGGRDGRA